MQDIYEWRARAIMEKCKIAGQYRQLYTTLDTVFQNGSNKSARETGGQVSK